MLAEQLQAATAQLFELPPPVLEWVELVERRNGQGTLAKLLFSLEAFIEKVAPELRRRAERGDDPVAKTWWPAVHDAADVVYQGRLIGLTDTRSKMPQYHGRFDADLFKRMLMKIRSESDHDSLKRAAVRALAMAA